MEIKNVTYLGEGVIINEYLSAAKTLFERTIDFVENGGVVFKEKEVLMILMDSVLTKINYRLLQEMVRTNKRTGELRALPEEFVPKDNVADYIWGDVDFDEFKNKLSKRLDVIKQNRKAEREDFNKVVKVTHLTNK